MSLRYRLLLVLISAVLLTTLTATGATYYWARHEIDQLLDYQLRQQALALRDKAYLFGSIGSVEPDPDQHIVIQVWDLRGQRLYFSHRTVQLPLLTKLGYGNATVNGEAWRIYAVALGPQVVQVAQPMSLRRGIATDAALRILYPTLAVVPLLAAIIWWLVGRVLSPLKRLTTAIARRDPQALDPIAAEGLPAEAGLIVAALNRLIERLRAALARERQFTADAAHELRTPLTALRLQTQLLERVQSMGEVPEAVAQLKAGVARAIHLVERMLALARLEPENAAGSVAPVDLAALAARVCQELAPLADARGVQLTLNAPSPAPFMGNEAALASMLANLLDNALRYTPPQGRVEVSVGRAGTSIVLTVSDDGPGIPRAERTRVFDRFHRVPGTAEQGSGLGLAIVKRAVEMHRGEVAILHGPGGTGTRIEVRIPQRAQ